MKQIKPVPHEKLFYLCDACQLLKHVMLACTEQRPVWHAQCRILVSDATIRCVNHPASADVSAQRCIELGKIGTTDSGSSIAT